MDTITTRMRASKHTYHDFFQYTRQTIKNGGFRPLYKGIHLTFYTSFVPNIIYFYTYQHLMKWISAQNYSNTVKMSFPFAASSFSQLLAIFMLLPFDTVRTRIQSADPHYNYNATFEALREIKQKEGFGRLFKSGKLLIAQTTLFAGIQLQLYETIRHFTERTTPIMIMNTLASTIIANIVCNPLDVLLTRYALVDTTKKELHLMRMVRKIKEREGIQGFYKGFIPKLFGSCIYTIFWFPLFDILRDKYGH